MLHVFNPFRRGFAAAFPCFYPGKHGDHLSAPGKQLAASEQLFSERSMFEDLMLFCGCLF